MESKWVETRNGSENNSNSLRCVCLDQKKKIKNNQSPKKDTANEIVFLAKELNKLSEEKDDGM